MSYKVVIPTTWSPLAMQTIILGKVLFIGLLFIDLGFGPKNGAHLDPPCPDATQTLAGPVKFSNIVCRDLVGPCGTMSYVFITFHGRFQCSNPTSLNIRMSPCWLYGDGWTEIA